MNARELVTANMPGWRLDSEITSEADGALVVAVRFDPDARLTVWREVWIDRNGAVTDAAIDSLGYVVSSDGARIC